MISSKGRSSILLCCSAVILTACVNTPRGYVAKEWSSSMRELGIIPVFPPREDVQVGDVYIAPVSPDEEIAAFQKTGFLPLGIWLTSLDLRGEITNFYASRASFPKTTDGITNFMVQLTNSPFASLPQASDQSRNIFVGGDTSRLRIVGFPSFMSATLNKGDLAAVVPVEAVNLAFGAGFSSARSVTISVPVAESYGVPVGKLWTKVMDAAGTRMEWEIPPSQLHNLINPSQIVRNGTNLYAPLRIIHEVYYTRALDVSVVSKTTRGFGIAGRPLATDVIRTVVSVASSNALGSATNAIPETTPTGATNTTNTVTSSTNGTASATSSNAPV